MTLTNEDAVWLLEQYGEKYMSMGTPSLLDAAQALVADLEEIGFRDEHAHVRGADCVDVICQRLDALRRGIAAEEEAVVKPAKSKRRVLTVTESAYDTILETLELDSRATNFDPKLRKQIRRALDSIQEVAPKVRIDVRGGCADVSVAPPYVEVRIVDHDNH
ncbi:MAG TPA: hypothetical protein VFU31_19340 [Candidatus Binatia bacterium]|nr:hypothetical protein [Candidatus Binatia bacterium]